MQTEIFLTVPVKERAILETQFNRNLPEILSVVIDNFKSEFSESFPHLPAELVPFWPNRTQFPQYVLQPTQELVELIIEKLQKRENSLFHGTVNNSI
jgi:hypothetical protein